MYYARPPRHPKIINFFRYYLVRTQFRNSPDRPSHTKPQQIIDDLHNLRLRYDRIGKGLKRLKTKRRYYKRVRDDAPYASRLPIKINGRIDWLRKIGKPADVIQFNPIDLSETDDKLKTEAK
jgi:hypothetical protein